MFPAQGIQPSAALLDKHIQKARITTARSSERSDVEG
jgi:hypothetical protein